jgi:ketosteroid isomerase-like protein
MRLQREFIRSAALALSIMLLLLSLVVVAQERGMPGELRALVETERAFSRMSEAKGMKEAFLSFAADDGVLFRRVVVNAKELWNKANPAPTGLLTWRPAFADISSGGDMGYTTGPWEFRGKATDKDAAGHGEFITVWRKQADGAWKFEADIGISHPAPNGVARTDVEYSPNRGKAKDAKAGISAEMANKALLDAEGELAKDANSKGAVEALLSHADEQLRVFRPDSFPLAGKASAREALKAKTSSVTWHADKTGAARSGDLGYVYGTYEARANAADAKPTEQGHYLRIWKRQASGKWSVVLDITNPVRPEGQ